MSNTHLSTILRLPFLLFEFKGADFYLRGDGGGISDPKENLTCFIPRFLKSLLLFLNIAEEYAEQPISLAEKLTMKLCQKMSCAEEGYQIDSNCCFRGQENPSSNWRFNDVPVGG